MAPTRQPTMHPPQRVQPVRSGPLPSKNGSALVDPGLAKVDADIMRVKRIAPSHLFCDFFEDAIGVYDHGTHHCAEHAFSRACSTGRDRLASVRLSTVDRQRLARGLNQRVGVHEASRPATPAPVEKKDVACDGHLQNAVKA